MPHNIVAPEMLRSLMLDLLERSDTFREQCRLIAAAPVKVEVRLVPKYVVAPNRAISTMKRYRYGWLSVIIEIAAPCRCAELLGHEFEHVVEQIEGLDLDDLAVKGDSGVRIGSSGAFETDRAERTGRSVADQFGKSRSQAARFTSAQK